jgi:hypothetical protein
LLDDGFPQKPKHVAVEVVSDGCYFDIAVRISLQDDAVKEMSERLIGIDMEGDACDHCKAKCHLGFAWGTDVMCWARDLNQGLTNRKLACCPLNLDLRSEGVGGGGDDDDDHNHGDDKMYL